MPLYSSSRLYDLELQMKYKNDFNWKEEVHFFSLAHVRFFWDWFRTGLISGMQHLLPLSWRQLLVVALDALTPASVHSWNSPSQISWQSSQGWDDPCCLCTFIMLFPLSGGRHDSPFLWSVSVIFIWTTVKAAVFIKSKNFFMILTIKIGNSLLNRFEGLKHFA